MSESGVTPVDDLAAQTGEMVKVVIDPEVEAYPVLAIYTDDHDPRQWEVPAEMLARLRDAEREVGRIELEIVRYAADHDPNPAMFREWLEDR